MEKLSENELQYYNSLDVWTPIQAVAVINSIKPESLSFPLPEEIKLQLNVIYSAWEGRHFQNGCMGLFIKLPLKNPEYRNMIPEFISLEHDGYGMYDREEALIHLNVKTFKKWMVCKEIFPTLSIQCSMENGPTAEQDIKEKFSQVQKDTTRNTQYYSEELFSKYVEIAQNFCQERIEKDKQPCTKLETQEYLEKMLKKSDERFGRYSKLPERSFRKIWNTVPSELKRKQGVTTRR